MKSIKALFGVFVVVAIIYLAWKIMPPYMNNYQFQDAIESEARLDSYNNKSEQDIRDTMAKKARELDIPLAAEQIKVVRAGKELSISADYTVHVDIPIYPFDLHFAPATKNRMI